MHAEVLEFVEDTLSLWGRSYDRVVEFGSRDINGSVRSLFGECDYLGIDQLDGPGVDVVADAATYVPSWFDAASGARADVVVCCEVFEHARDWPALVHAAARLLKPEGLFIVTCAGPARGAHSAIDELPKRPEEFYANVEPAALLSELQRAFQTHREVRCVRENQDVQGWAVK